MSGWTPGPWGVSDLFADFVKDSDGGRIADCRIDGETTEQTIANARLIAAAPDLAEALRCLSAEVNGLHAFERAFREVYGNSNWEALQHQASKARAALAKARGEA